MPAVVFNLLLTAFILGMGYMWLSYGLFSAFIHLIAVICAGALALAIWEPFTLGVLMDLNAHLAWGVGLLAPFGILLLLIRVGTDKAVPDGIKLPRLVDTIGGAVFGLISGVLTAGLIVIGLGFLPLAPGTIGVRSYVVGPTGGIQEGDQDLWVPADRIASGFFSWASAGGFASSTPLRLYRPNLARDAATAGLAKDTYDPNQNLYAAPENVALGEIVRVDSAMLEQVVELDDRVEQAMPGGRDDLLVAETVWQASPEGAYDSDTTLRLPPVQVALITVDDDGGDPQEVEPIAFVGKSEAGLRDVYFHPIEDNLTLPYGFATNDERIRWVFQVAPDREARFLKVRQLRLAIDEEEVKLNDGPAFADAVGEFSPEVIERRLAEEAEADTPIGAREGAVAGTVGRALQQTNELPERFDKNRAPGVETVREDGGRGEQLLMEGSATVSDTRARAGRATTVSGFFVPSHQRMVRLEISPDLGASLLGQIRASAASVQPIYFTDDQGNRLLPFAYVWMKEGGGMELSANRTQPFRSASQLPIRSMNRNDRLYLYFLVQPNAILEQLHIGSGTSQDLDFEVN